MPPKIIIQTRTAQPSSAGTMGIRLPDVLTNYPSVNASESATKLYTACSHAFEWGVKQAEVGASPENPPAAQGDWQPRERELIAAAARAGAFTNNAIPANKLAYAGAYGAALLIGLEYGLSGKPLSEGKYGQADVWQGLEQTKGTLWSVYTAAWAVYGKGSDEDKSGGSSEGTGVGTIAVIGLGIAAVGGGIWWWLTRKARR